MQHFHYQHGALYAEQVALADIAQRYGTPCYVYSRAAIEQQWHSYDLALGKRPHLICYAVKANANLAILNLLARLGSGFDVVSAGELARVIKAGGDPRKVVFSGVGKQAYEMKAALEAGIKCFNVESRPELQLLNSVAGQMNCKAPVSIRVNPDVDAMTHPYISTGLKENKFGISIDEAESVYREAAGLAHLQLTGIDCHIGSQITTTGPHIDACKRVMQLAARLKAGGIVLHHIDIGGGLGITYANETPPDPAEFIRAVTRVITDESLELLIEPGRSIIGNAGVLLTSVLYVKETAYKNFAIVDAAMNDLIRPVLYDAWQQILPVQQQSRALARNYDVVGPICETGDFLGLDRSLAIEPGDMLAVCSVGAYGFSMSSNYNARPRAAEILVDSDQIYEIRLREGIQDLYRGEQILP
jgi:diaminopimelate decarboxylase